MTSRASRRRAIFFNTNMCNISHRQISLAVVEIECCSWLDSLFFFSSSRSISSSRLLTRRDVRRRDVFDREWPLEPRRTAGFHEVAHPSEERMVRRSLEASAGSRLANGLLKLVTAIILTLFTYSNNATRCPTVSQCFACRTALACAAVILQSLHSWKAFPVERKKNTDLKSVKKAVSCAVDKLTLMHCTRTIMFSNDVPIRHV